MICESRRYSREKLWFNEDILLHLGWHLLRSTAPISNLEQTKGIFTYFISGKGAVTSAKQNLFILLCQVKTCFNPAGRHCHRKNDKIKTQVYLINTCR